MAMTIVALMAAWVAGGADRPAAYPCWIAQVAREGTGVRIAFVRGAPVRAGEESVHAEVGATLTPANSGHDGCTLTVARRDGAIGVEAAAHLFLPGIMTEPQVRRDWIAAR